MARKSANSPVKMAFEENARHIPIADILPLRVVSEAIKKSQKYAQIVSSIREVGIIEPPVVVSDRSAPGKYLLLDGHLRLAVLKDIGEAEVLCLVSLDDEAFTYNRRISRLAIIQEHKMILKAIERGVPENRIAAALNIEVKTLQLRKHLLDGICPEASEILKDKHVSIATFSMLRKMAPIRQIEAAEVMVSMNRYSSDYAKSLLASTPQSQLVNGGKSGAVKGLTDEQMAIMERESGNLEREFKIATQSYGADHLDLVLAKGYLSRLLANAKVVRYLAQHHREYLAEFQKIADIEPASV
jgi:hypothetical protein